MYYFVNDRRKEINRDEIDLAKFAIKTVDHTIRKKIIDHLSKNDRSTVTDIYIALRQEQSVISQHLKWLKKYKLVNFYREGKNCIYSCDEKGASHLKKMVVGISNIGISNLGGSGVAFEILRSLANNFRMSILNYLEDNPGTTVNKIYRDLRIEQSATSQALGVLLSAGIVTNEREGKYIKYSIDYDVVNRVCKSIDNYNQFLLEPIS